jgi:hypothetical protein
MFVWSRISVEAKGREAKRRKEVIEVIEREREGEMPEE